MKAQVSNLELFGKEALYKAETGELRHESEAFETEAVQAMEIVDVNVYLTNDQYEKLKEKIMIKTLVVVSRGDNRPDGEVNLVDDELKADKFFLELNVYGDRSGELIDSESKDVDRFDVDIEWIKGKILVFKVLKYDDEEVELLIQLRVDQGSWEALDYVELYNNN